MDISNVYKIETERLLIRCYEPSDAAILLDAITTSLNHLTPWLAWARKEPTDLDAKINLLRKFRGQFDLGEDYNFGIFDKSEKKFIGSTGLHKRLGPTEREIGYWINVKHINKGYALETVSALTRAGFEFDNLSRIEIHCSVENERSQNIPKKLGFKLERTLTASLHSSGNSQVWAMSKTDYETSAIKSTSLKAYDITGREINNPQKRG